LNVRFLNCNLRIGRLESGLRKIEF
jgi:hypothetical protein